MLPRDDQRSVFVISADPDANVLCRGILPFPIAAPAPGESVLQAIARTRPGVVIAQVVEPTDWQIIGGLKSSPLTERIPVIVLTGPNGVDETFRRCAHQLGCSAILVTPCCSAAEDMAMFFSFLPTLWVATQLPFGRRTRKAPILGIPALLKFILPAYRYQEIINRN